MLKMTNAIASCKIDDLLMTAAKNDIPIADRSQYGLLSADSSSFGFISRDVSLDGLMISYVYYIFRDKSLNAQKTIEFMNFKSYTLYLLMMNAHYYS